MTRRVRQQTARSLRRAATHKAVKRQRKQHAANQRYMEKIITSARRTRDMGLEIPGQEAPPEEREQPWSKQSQTGLYLP